MTTRRRSFDQDDRSTDTSNTNKSNLSKNSEYYLARIQQETHRIQKKTKKQKDHKCCNNNNNNNSNNHNNNNSKTETTAAEAHNNLVVSSPSSSASKKAKTTTTLSKESSSSSYKSKQQNTKQINSKSNNKSKSNRTDINEISLIPNANTNCSSFDSSFSTATSPSKQPQHLNWSDIVNSSERSNRSLLIEEENNLTLRDISSRSSPRSCVPIQPAVQEEEDEQQQSTNETPPPPEKKHYFPTSFFSNSNRNTNNRSSKRQQRTNKQRFKKKTMSSALETTRREHEAFSKKLIDEVLGKDSGDKVSMEKVVMIIWQFRDDKDVIKFMTRFVSKFAGSRDVFDGIEFYLPQLAHMMIHLETEWDDAILERFSLVIAQQSIHFALQLNWILAGAIEDYQPELPDGTPNPTYNPLYYFRCVKLLTNIERCVVYRRPRSQELQRLYEKGKITKSEMHSLEQADRRFTAMQITNDSPDAIDERETFGGTLKYKRAVRTSLFKFKRWKTRYFAVEERMLNCYNTEGGTLVRSMPLEGATVRPMKSKYPNMFSVTNRSFEFRMRASSEEDRDKWIKMLQNEAKTGRVFGHTDGSLFLDENADALRVIDELTPSQRERYKFYRNEREFVRRLTDIAEDLRFQEPSERKKVAPEFMKDLEIPSNAYSPLMSSTDIFRRIHSTLSKDTRVFNTKARCPTVMYFLGVRGELEYEGERHANMDIAEYIHLQFDAKNEQQSGSDWKSSELKTRISEDGKEVLEVELDVNHNLSPDRKEHLVVKKTVATIEEEAYTNVDGAGPFTPQQRSSDEKHSMVWSGSFAAAENTGEPTPQKRSSSDKKGHYGSPTRANRHLKKFLHESMISIPRTLANHLERKSYRQSGTNGRLSDSSSATSKVPIAMGRQVSMTHGIGEDVYVGKSSVMGSHKIIKGRSKAGDIDEESMNRAKKVIGRGESWAETSFRMLERVQNKPKDEKVQLEIVCLLSKSNDDLRQEVFVMQMIHYYKSVFIAAGLPLWLKTYKILSTSASTGLLEFMVDSTSLDGLKKSEHYPEEGGLRKYFEDIYGGPDSKSFKAAQRNFMQSLAAYSIVCYLLGLKDRHNGNIMIDMRGHLIHIDYGFCMGMCVGHEATMERAPFKMTEEFVAVMGGPGDECYKEFQRLFVAGMKEARSKCQIALGLVEIMMYRSNYPCFSGRRYGGGQALRGFRERLMLDIPEELVEAKALGLIQKAYNHWGTRAYDSFQQWSNGYAI